MRKKTEIKYAGDIHGYEFARDKIDDLYTSIGFDNICKSHFHKQVELFYVLKGNLNCEINNKMYEIKKGDLVICNPFDIHSFIQSEPALTFVLSIPTRFLPYLEKCSNGSRFDGNIITESEITKQVYNLMRQIMRNQDGGDLFLLGKTFLIFSLISQVMSITTANPIEDSLIFKIINFIDKNYTEQISLENLANHCGYSKNYVSKEFNKNFNCNINEYINLKRLQAFITLHQSNGENIISNALAVGFNSSRTFYNAFSDHYGMSPKEYFATEKKLK